mmetsp:Transcript_4971/g.14471  ORF Transcript_4971/g.14471 Transcript_4971/m.14471 type:complete len:269 (+) Transcript_4971:593-1399(+)
MAQRLVERDNLALRRLNLGVELVALPLQLVSLLRRLDDEVRLRLRRAVLVGPELALEVGALGREPVDTQQPLRQRLLGAGALVLRRLELRAQHVGVHLDLLLPLRHRELQLALAVLEPEDAVRPAVQRLAQLLDLEPQQVGRHRRLLPLLRLLLDLLLRERVVDLDRVDGRPQPRLLRRHLLLPPPRALQLVGQPLLLLAEHARRRALLLELPLQRSDLGLELGLLLCGADAGGARNLPLHELQLEVGGVEHLPLPLRLLVELPHPVP